MLCSHSAPGPKPETRHGDALKGITVKDNDTTGILVASDQILLRAGLRELLHTEPNLDVVGEALDENETIYLTGRLEPDIVLMVVLNRREASIGVTKRLKAQHPDIGVILVTSCEDTTFARDIIRAGASGYLPTRAAQSELINAIHAIRRGDLYIHPSMTRCLLYGQTSPAVARVPPRKPLTRREAEILGYIAQGHTNRQIAELLFVSVRTVESHRARLLGKLNAHCRMDLVRHAANLDIR